jgi:hypothetical protein
VTQGSDGTITVHGEAVVAAVPDQIGFRLTASAVKDRSEDALQDVTARGGQLDQLAAGARGTGAEGIELDPTLEVTGNVTITYGIDGDAARGT